MKTVPKAAAAALAFLILLFSSWALCLGVATPQYRGPLFWAVSGGFLLQAIVSAAWLARLIAWRLRDAANGGTQAASRH